MNKTLLVEALKKVLADSFTFYLKAHAFHWNVVGSDFMQFHQLFETVYSEVYGSIDTTAELIRALDDIAPGSLKRFQDLTTITEAEGFPSAQMMVSQLLHDNDIVLSALLQAYKAAEDAGEVGISNSMQDRILAHQKHAWFLRSYTK